MRPLSRDVGFRRRAYDKHLAFAPLEVVGLGDLEVGRVGREQAGGGGYRGGEEELRVDVEWEVSTAWGPHF